jgi:Domain of unknown function (DUF397)
MTQPEPVVSGEFAWRTARLCNGGACVRVARSGDMVVIGDSKDPHGPVLSYSRAEWLAFADGVTRGDFDDLL